MSLKITYFLPSSALWQFATLLGPGKRSPPSPPKKGFFLSFPKETWHLVGSVFWGGPKWKTGTALVSPHFFLNIKLPFWDIDGATPTHSLKSGWECPHRWRNSLILPTSINQPNQKYATSIRVIPRQKAKPPGKTSELSQDRRQNHQERHQSCPFWDIDGATSVILPAKVETL